MTDSARCPDCAGELNEHGLCPKCLLKLGMSGAVPGIDEAQASSTSKPVTPPALIRRRWTKASAAAAVAVLVIAGFTIFRPRDKPPAGPVVRFAVPLDGGSEFAVSPDGTKLAYTKEDMLWIRRMDAPEGEALPGTEGAESPFWSPDSRYTGFFSRGKLKITSNGSTPRILCDAPGAHGGTWSQDGTILFAAAGVFRVSTMGGTAQRLQGETHVRSPVMLPDNRHFLYSVMSTGSNAGIYAGNLDSGAMKLLVRGVTSPVAYSEGYLLFLRDRALFAQKFDVHLLELEGEARPLRFADHVDQVSASLYSSNGVLAYWSGGQRATQLMWIDRSGKLMSQVGEPGEQQRFAISPDGTQAVVAPGLWMLDFARETSARLTFDPIVAGGPVWSPDASRIAFSAQDPAPGSFESSLYIVPAGGAGAPELLLKARQEMSVDSWSSDGRFIIYTAREPGKANSLWSIGLGDGHAPMTIVKGNFNALDGQFSPDGRWIAYISDESEREEVYVQPFSRPGGKWQISISGGGHPQWRRDGKELFFVTPEHLLMSVEIDSGSNVFRTGAARPLFKLPGRSWYASAADGRRFLVSVPVERGTGALNFVLNWVEEMQN